ncbi:MAG: phosphatase PAP2 family protein [Actinomycetota bacterium]|nr:phosphatase PAP2 family protein [Actinomycetota bacterium]
MAAHRRRFVLSPTGLLGRSGLFAGTTGWIERFDARVEQAIAPWRGKAAADRVFYGASSLGEFSLIWVALALARALRGGRVNERAAARALLGTCVEFLLVNGLVKSLVGRKRPLEAIEHPLPFRQPLTSSFPSGHATAAFCAATLLGEQDAAAPGYLAAAAVIATSRLYVRIHHASDVIGGAIIGLGLGYLLRRLMPLEPRRSDPT